MNVTEFFGVNSPLKLHLKGFEERKEQLEFAQDVMRAFYDEKVVLIEAGTGIGKSLAYLIPALAWSVRYGEPVVIATHTIALQEQLVEKDIPLALQVLGLEAKVTLAKGMGNYVCLRKLHELRSEKSLFSLGDEEEIEKIQEAMRYSRGGSKSNLGFIPSTAVWQKVAAESVACNFSECPHFHDCFFFKARKEMQEAHLIITNHHLLFADIARRKATDNFSNNAVLPYYSRLIVDEAHHVEDVATEYFAERCSRGELLGALHEIVSEKSEKGDVLTRLRQKLVFFLKEHTLIHKIDRDIPLARNEALAAVHKAFEELISFCTLFPVARESSEENSTKFRLKAHHVTHPFWQGRVVPALQLAVKQINDLIQLLFAVDKGILDCKNGNLNEETKSMRVDLNAFLSRLGAYGTVLDSCSRYVAKDDKVQWIEQLFFSGRNDVALVCAEHNVAPLLKKYLFQNLKTAVLCSATLATQENFSYIRSRIGVDEGVMEKLYHSPFDYKNQALFGVPIDLPLPEEGAFSRALPDALVQCVEASRGNAFILFTSYNMLKVSYDSVEPLLTERGFFLLKQGDDSRQALIRRFKEKPRSILFGTDSFWEGVDVAGDALRCVIITKLPFHVPSDPIQEARCEKLTQEKKSPFVDYSVPRAVVKFKQAFGRLIRTKSDRGCVICLDTRLIKRGYGKFFLQSLPQCTQTFEPLKTLAEKMRVFYKGG